MESQEGGGRKEDWNPKLTDGALPLLLFLLQECMDFMHDAAITIEGTAIEEKK